MVRLVMLARDGEATRVLYHSLRREFEVVRVILEDPISRWRLLARRFRRYGLATVAGQLLFQTLVVPALRVRARGRHREIVRQLGLRDQPIDGDRLLRVP